MACNGICKQYQAKKINGYGRYTIGQKRCQVCEIFIKWDGLFCPCCHYRIRTKPRNRNYKANLKEKGVTKLIQTPILQYAKID